jgi:DNA invertase Pin-like site-specific DNA recombinase
VVKKLAIKPLKSKQEGWALYLRTSDADLQNPANSQERQRDAIMKALVEPSGLPVLHEYIDIDSGRNTQRLHYTQMLDDAELGRFSHVAFHSTDRFGRDAAEAFRAVKMLLALGITVYFANMPTVNANNYNERFILGVLFMVDATESLRIGERTKGGMMARQRSGHMVGCVPDGYVRLSTPTIKADRLVEGQFTRHVELDPVQAAIWRKAWEMLLTNHYTLAQICEELHNMGYTFKSGRPFVVINKQGKPAYAPYAPT